MGRFRDKEYGTCLSFNGTSDKVTTSLWSNSNSGLSFAARFKSINYKQTRQVILSNGDGSGGSLRGIGLVLSGNSTTDGSMYAVNHVLNWINLGFKVQDSLWHHIVMVLNSSSSITTYLDGISKGTVTGISPTLATPTTNSFIGSDDGTGFFYGKIDDVRVYNSILSSDDQSNLYFGNELSTLPLNWYKLDEGSGASATDSGSSAKTGTISGATYSTDVFRKARTKIT